MSAEEDLASEIISNIQWPKNWSDETKEDFAVWIRNVIYSTPGFAYNKKLQELIDSLITFEEKTTKAANEGD